MKKIILLLGMLFLSSDLIGAPSFSCDRAKNKAEIAICGSERLSSIDQDLSSIYAQVREGINEAIAQRIEESQIRWLSFRNRCSENIRCINQTYESRIYDLKELLELKEFKLLNDAGLQCFIAPVQRKDPLTIERDKPLNLDINNDSNIDLVKHKEIGCGAGSGQFDCFGVYDNRGDSIEIKFAETFVEGRAFLKNPNVVVILGYTDFRHSSIKYVSVIAPNNREYPVCSFHEKNAELEIRIPYEMDWGP